MKNLIWGCGQKGLEALQVMQASGETVEGFIDNNALLLPESCSGIPVFDPSALDELAEEDSRIIIAVTNIKKVSLQLESIGIKKYECYYNERITYIGNIKDHVTGISIDYVPYLSERPVYVIGTGKLQRDFEYIFNWFEIDGYLSEGNAAVYQDKPVWRLRDVAGLPPYRFIVICEEESDCYIKRLEAVGMVYGEDFIHAIDLFRVLDVENHEGYFLLPSQMMKITVLSKGENQEACLSPFRDVNISSRYGVHVCCPDYLLPIGYLELSDPAEAWNSIYAKIIRLSIINKTFCFCNHRRCVKLKIKPGITEERLSDISVSITPKLVEIGIDRTCNYFCDSCRDTIITADAAKLQKMEEIKDKILASGWIEDAKQILIGGTGEPFFSKIYRSLIFDHNGKRNTIIIRTNGSLLDRNTFEDLRKLYSQVNIIISIDAASEETYRRLRRSNIPNSWSKLNDNLYYLSEMKKSGQLAWLQINMVVQMKNYQEVPDFIRMGIKYGADKIHISPIRNWGTYTEEEFERIKIYQKEKVLRKEVKEILAHPLLKEKSVECVIFSDD